MVLSSTCKLLLCGFFLYHSLLHGPIDESKYDIVWHQKIGYKLGLGLRVLAFSLFVLISGRLIIFWRNGYGYMLFTIEFIITFLVAFGLNLIPFFGPSNLLIASTAAIGMVNADATALLTIALLIALAAALAKGIHYLITFFVSGHLSQKSQQRLDKGAGKIKRWAFLLLYLAAATPIPDEPVVIPLGLMKYSPPKFFLSYFLGKITITGAGVFLGSWVEANFSGLFSPLEMIALSITLTVIITIVMFKVDVGKETNKIIKKLKGNKKQTSV